MKKVTNKKNLIVLYEIPQMTMDAILLREACQTQRKILSYLIHMWSQNGGVREAQTGVLISRTWESIEKRAEDKQNDWQE